MILSVYPKRALQTPEQYKMQKLVPMSATSRTGHKETQVWQVWAEEKRKEKTKQASKQARHVRQLPGLSQRRE